MPRAAQLPFTLPRSGFRGTEFYRLAPSPYKTHEALLEYDVGRRGRDLAKALGGIQPGERHGYRLSPARCIKWLALFSAGFEAEKIGEGFYGNWRFRVSGGSLVTLDEAMRTAETINNLP